MRPSQTSNSVPATLDVPPTLIAPYLISESTADSSHVYSITATGIKKVAKHLSTTDKQAMVLCLQEGIWPRRFIRNRGTITANQQLTLVQSHVAIIGCGGLGGYVASLLVRFGVGSLTICDYDTFDESNLNRQLFCHENCLGMNKAFATKKALTSIASYCTVHAYQGKATPENLPEILHNAHIAVDCLDNLQTRLEVEKAAHFLEIPFIHGALAGLEGFVFCSMPVGNSSVSKGTQADKNETNTFLPRLYTALPDTGTGAEIQAGVPPCTPPVIAAMQVRLVILALMHACDPTQVLFGSPVASLLSSQLIEHLDLTVPALELFHI